MKLTTGFSLDASSGTSKDAPLPILPKREIPVFDFTSIHELVRYIGYAKHINDECRIFLRGQSCLYGSMLPSLLRDRPNHLRAYNDFGKWARPLKMKINPKNDLPNSTFYPLLQHYGFKTPYLDVVDNIWTALWFSLHTASCVVAGQHEHVDYKINSAPYSYLLLLASDAIKEISPGIYEGNDSELIDLRKALPSIYLRPHMQHAYAIKHRGTDDLDLMVNVVGIAKFSTALGLEWLGNGSSLSTKALFPSAAQDIGYRGLLKKLVINTGSISEYGSVQIVS